LIYFGVLQPVIITTYKSILKAIIVMFTQHFVYELFLWAFWPLSYSRTWKQYLHTDFLFFWAVFFNLILVLRCRGLH